MKRVEKIDELMQEGQLLLHIYQNDTVFAKVKEVQRGDRDRVLICMTNNEYATMAVHQKHLDEENMEIYTYNKTDDPEYFL